MSQGGQTPEEFREAELSSDMNVAKVHGSILRERAEPRDGYEPISLWLITFCFGLIFWAGMYLVMHSGGFRADVYNTNLVAWDGSGSGAAEKGPPDPMVVGKRVFTQYCAVCHQTTGLGVAGQFPPLVDSEWVLAREWHGDNHLVKIVLHGLQGPITVKGAPYNNAMAPWGGVLNDEQIAAVLTYIRNEWGNSAPPITPEFVAEVRAQTQGRAEAWTQKELQAIERVLIDSSSGAQGSEAPPPPPESAAPAPAFRLTPPRPLAFIPGMLFRPLLVAVVLCAAPAAFAQESVPNLYWAPENMTVGGKQIDGMLNVIFWLTFAVFLATQTVYLYYLIKYRRRPGVKAVYSHGNNTLEIVWTSIPTLIFLGLAIASNRIWFNIHSDPPADALKVNISSYQFGWDMRYPGADGRLGRIEVGKIGVENKFGLDPADPAAADDFTSMELVIPANRPVHVYLNARDVIHSFYVPAFRLYQDAVPGRTITWMWFEVVRPGKFELACSQLCGTGHYNMKAPIRVLPPEEFDNWYAEKSRAVLEASAGPPGISPAVAAAHP